MLKQEPTHILIRQVTVPLEYTDEDIRRALVKKLGCRRQWIGDIEVRRRSLDARPRFPSPRYVLSVLVNWQSPKLPQGGDIDPVPDLTPWIPPTVSGERAARPVVVGAGPAGLMAAWVLARAGARPILIERGDAAVPRAARVARFWADGTLDPESNALYGAGGAGLFSDGKLTTRTKDRRRLYGFFQVLVECGADPSILIDAEPHVGSDVLLRLVPRFCADIERRGGSVHFRTRLTGLVTSGGRLRALRWTGPMGDQERGTDRCVLATGHSARDVYALLAGTGVPLEIKPFAVGVRLELPQATIDRGQYGRHAGHARLGAASFRLTRRPENGLRACYSFCMCPGGQVIACASEPGYLTTNGMSYASRGRTQGNAAFLVPVGPEDFPATENPVLAGIAFQRYLEKRAYAAGGEAYAVAASRLTDFLAGRSSVDLPEERSCLRSVPVNLRDVLPAFVSETLCGSIGPMLGQINGASPGEVLLYAAETRSSSPVRILRDAQGRSTGLQGLYPAGEGAGYAGGITTSALDGMRAAEACLTPSS
jgi:uncharacterized FAD-dependent dehydrogenase